MFQELSFYKTYIEKPNVTKVKNIDWLSELPFYEELSIVKSDQAFEGYEMGYKVEVIEKKIKRKWNWIFSCLFQFNNKNSD